MFASNVTQMAVISGWYGSYGSIRPRGHVRHIGFGDGGHAKCAMGPKQSLGAWGGPFWPEIPMSELRGVLRHVLGLQFYPTGCNFWLEWFLCINGTGGTCQASRFGGGVHARCSMSPKRLLERVFFSLKSPCLRGVQWHVHGLQGHPSDCTSYLL